MEIALWVLGIAAVVWAVVKMDAGHNRKRGGFKPIADRPAQPAVTTAKKPKPAPPSPVGELSFDIDDPTIGNPREKMTQLSWVQASVLNYAASGLRIAEAEPGRAHSETPDGVYYQQPRTVRSLVRAGFLREAGGGTYAITPLGMKAHHVLPHKSN